MFFLLPKDDRRHHEWKRNALKDNLSVSILNCGYDSGTYPLIEIANQNDVTVDVFVDIGAVDSDGTVVDSTKIIQKVPAGRTAQGEGFITNSYYNVSCEILDISVYER